MCGIAGYYCPRGRAVRSPESIRTDTLQSVLAHRGPDSNGTWTSQNGEVFLFHARLAIQDLSPHGHQPMGSRCGRFKITFNGEIYNFRKLASKLVTKGVSLRGHSDTEVLLEYIACFGLKEALEAAVGMFAFALYDREQERLYIARDRLGEKPLYWFFDRGMFAFASELKGLTAMIGELGELDRVSLSQYFRYGYVPDPRSIFEKVQKLTPGTLLEIPVSDSADYSALSLDHFLVQHSQTYWRVADVKDEGLYNPFETLVQAVTTIHELLQRTVADHAVADVGLGVYLSGGVDSTLVTALLQSQSDMPVNSFTVGFHDSAYDEAGFAKQISRYLGTEHHELRVTETDLLGLVDRIPDVYDEPFANPSQIPTMLLANYARQHVKVCLSGDGGDELFAGYNRYIWGAKVSAFNRRHSWVTRRALSGGADILRRFSSSLTKMISALRGGPVQGIEGKLTKARAVLGLESESELYDFLLSNWHHENPIDGYASNSSLSHSGFDRGDFINAAMFSDQIHYLPGDNLVKVDRASMAASLEVRLPLLSHEVLSLAWRVPSYMRVSGGVSKVILREILYQYVPRRLIERPKMGFSVPLGAWLRTELREWASDLMASTAFKESEILDHVLIDNLWEEHLSGSADRSAQLWCALIYFQWQDSHNRIV